MAIDLTYKNTGDSYSALEFDGGIKQLTSALLTQVGITANGAYDALPASNQFGQGLNRLSLARELFTDSGATNAYVLTTNTIFLTPLTNDGYYNGLTVMFKAANTNTGASTVNIDTLGIKSIVKQNNSALVGGEIVVGSYTKLVYNGTNFVIANIIDDALSSLYTTNSSAYLATQFANLASAIAGTGGKTYSVISGYRVSGVAGFINPTPVSSTSIGFLVDSGSTYGLIVSKFPDSTTQSLSALANITGMSSDGLYNIVLEKGQSVAFASINTITENTTAPISPTNGDYWLDISVAPYIPYKYVSGSWVVTQYVKLGQVTKTAGTMGTPITYAIDRKYVGSITPGPSATTITTFPHNIGSSKVTEEYYAQIITTTSGLTTGRFYKQDTAYVVASGVPYPSVNKGIDSLNAYFINQNQGIIFPTDNPINGTSQTAPSANVKLWCYVNSTF